MVINCNSKIMSMHDTFAIFMVGIYKIRQDQKRNPKKILNCFLSQVQIVLQKRHQKP